MNAVNEVIFGNFLDGLQAARNEDGLRAAVDRFALSMGFRFFAYFSRGHDISVVTSYPKIWQARYFSKEYYRVDPLLTGHFLKGGAMTWSGPEMARSREQRTFFGEARDLGIVGGVTIPLSGTFGRTAALTFAGPDPDRRDVLEPENAELLKMGALYFDAYFNSLGSRKSSTLPQKLTPREKHVLTWIANGKTVTEAARLLEISRPTAAFHVASARLKLGAATLPQAVCLAMNAKEITIP